MAENFKANFQNIYYVFICANKIFTNYYSISIKLGKIMPYYVDGLQKLR